MRGMGASDTSMRGMGASDTTARAPWPRPKRELRPAPPRTGACRAAQGDRDSWSDGCQKYGCCNFLLSQKKTTHCCKAEERELRGDNIITGAISLKRYVLLYIHTQNHSSDIFFCLVRVSGLTLETRFSFVICVLCF